MMQCNEAQRAPCDVHRQSVLLLSSVQTGSIQSHELIYVPVRAKLQPLRHREAPCCYGMRLLEHSNENKATML